MRRNLWKTNTKKVNGALIHTGVAFALTARPFSGSGSGECMTPEMTIDGLCTPSRDRERSSS